MGRQYRDKEWLREKYVEEKLPLAEVGEICDVSCSTIVKWRDRHGLPKRSRSESLRRAHGTNEGKYNDPEWLYKEYVENEKSGLELADECGVHVDTIYKRLDEHNIDRRSIKDATNASNKMGWKGREHPAWNESIVPLYTHGRDNYECWVHNWDNSRESVFVHRLLAVSEYGIDAVKDKHVHHKNGIRWDNRPENIELLTISEHTKRHHEQGDYPQSAE